MDFALSQADNTQLKPAQDCLKIHYPKPDGVLTFDKLRQVYLSNTTHREGQPCHLVLKDLKIPIDFNFKKFAGPEQRYCPANVYEFVTENDKVRLQINAAIAFIAKRVTSKIQAKISFGHPQKGETALIMLICDA